METTAIKRRKRKIIDIDDNTFRTLLMGAAAANTNLKVYIENLLDNYAEELQEAQLYGYLLNSRPEGHLVLNQQEKRNFETWLGI